MSFSFRNIFTPDGELVDGGAPQGISPDGSMADGAAGNGMRAGIDVPSISKGNRQTFLVSELIAFIPKAIVAQSGIPMDKEVHIPLPADGSGDVKLSVIFQHCPELFAAEITPRNDVMMTLPPKIGSMDPAMAASKGFNSPLPGATTSSSAGNPFWSAPPKDPASVNPPQVAQAQTEKSSFGFQDPTSAAAKKEGFSFSSIVGSPPESPDAGGFESMGNAASGGFSGGIAGFSGKPTAPSNPAGKFEGPTSAADSKGNLNLQKPFESEAGFTTLFSKQAAADEGLPFPGTPTPAKPTEELKGGWGAMFADAKSPQETEESRNGETSFAPPSFESIGNLLNQGAKPNPSSGFGSFAPLSEPETPNIVPIPPESTNAFSDVPKSFGASEAKPGAMLPGFSAFQTPAASPVQSVDPPALEQPSVAVPASTPVVNEPAPMVPAPAPVVPAPVLEPVPVQNPSLENAESIEAVFSSFAAGFASAPPAESAPPVEEVPVTQAPVLEVMPDREVVSLPPFSTPPLPVQEAPPVPFAARPSFEPPPFSPRPASPAPINEDSRSNGFEMKDLELKAIFSTSEAFDLAKVARRVVDLPGVQSCSLSIPGKLIQATREEGSRLGSDAMEMIATLRNLAKLTGLPEARNFTLHTDRGIVSLFLEGDCCVTVNHECATFQPGVREKLIIVARSLIHLDQ